MTVINFFGGQPSFANWY